MFKTLSLLAILSLSSQLMAVVGDEVPLAVPTPAQKVLDSYKSRINAKIIELNRIKIDEIGALEKAQKLVVASNDLEGALVVKKLIDDLKKEVEISDPASKSVFGGNDQIAGKWKKSLDGHIYELTSDNIAVCDNGNKGKWKIENNSIVIDVAGWVDTISIKTSGDTSKHSAKDNRGRTFFFTKE